MKIFNWIVLFVLVITSSGCEGPYSILNVAGDSSKIIADMFGWLVIGAILIWTVFTSILVYSLLRPGKHNARTTSYFIIGGGAVVPLIILCFLLYFSLSPLPELLKPSPKGSLEVEVHGVQWWWRVRYKMKDKAFIELANEIRLPVNEHVQFYLMSEDVIHSFWIPSLGGKVDMIPGRKNMLSLRPFKTGTYVGVCAEYCGSSHSLMKMKVVVMTKDKFDQWLSDQGKPAASPSSAIALRGQNLFKSYGCTACHSVRGVDSTGVVGPDLTHVGSRLSLGAGILPNVLESYHKWIIHPDRIKPEVKMPSFKMLPPEDIRALSTWLKGLQ